MGGVREEKGGEGGQGRVSDNMCNGQRYKKKKVMAFDVRRSGGCGRLMVTMTDGRSHSK